MAGVEDHVIQSLGWWSGGFTHTYIVLICIRSFGCHNFLEKIIVTPNSLIHHFINRKGGTLPLNWYTCN
jgi:hypothetical protein